MAFSFQLSALSTWRRKKGKRAVVFTTDGRLVFANSARRLKNAVKEACEAISKD
jgi:hypothetical protein